MKFNTIKIIFALTICSFGSFAQSGKFTIDGKVNSRYNGKFIKIYYQQQNVKVIDSTTVSSGRFQLSGTLSAPALGKLSMGGEDTDDRIDIFLSEGVIKVAAKDSVHYATVSGTKLAEDHERLAKSVRPVDDQFFTKFRAIKDMPEGEAKKAYITTVLAGFDSYNRFKRESIHQFAKENPNSYVALYHLDKSAPGSLANYETTYPYFEKLSTELKDSPLGKQLGARLLASKGKLTGSPYKDFVSTTPEGAVLSLKDVVSKNKYTLVDFWASWCGPCRKENPNVVKTYNDFKAKGFTVLSVSLDEDADKWKAAIEKDGMPWYHVSSLKGWKEPAAVLYGVRAIPQNVLVDAQGKVVAENLRAETLYQKVEQLLK